MRRLLNILLALVLLTCTCAEAYGQKRTSKTVRKEQQDAKRKAQKTQKEIEENKRRTRSQLNDLNLINSQLDANRAEVTRLEGQIAVTQSQIDQTTDSITHITELVTTMKANAARSLRNARSMEQSKSVLGMIFSAGSFRQAVKRIGYAKQLDKWRVSKTQALKEQIALLDAKKERLAQLSMQQSAMLADLSAKRDQLDSDLAKSQQLMDDLKRQGQTLEAELQDRNRQLRRLDQELERIIAEEARLAAEAERKRQEEARRAEEARLAEEARQKAEREKAEAEERQRLLAEQQKQAEEQKRQQEAEKQAAAQKDKDKKDRKSTKSGKDKDKSKDKNKDKGKGTTTPPPTTIGRTDVAVATPKTTPTTPPTATSAPAGSFAQLKGRMGSPIEGKATIVGHFGRSQHGTLSRIEVDNTGIDIQGSKGAGAKAVCDGTVSSIFNLDGYNNIVMVRHGEYLTVYANIGVLSVKKGDTVKAGQRLGIVYSDPDDGDRTILHFEVCKEREKLNPEEWVVIK